MSNMSAKQICHGAYVQAFPDDKNIQKKEFQTICFIFFLSTGLYFEETKRFKNMFSYLGLETDLVDDFPICLWRLAVLNVFIIILLFAFVSLYDFQILDLGNVDSEDDDNVDSDDNKS